MTIRIRLGDKAMDWLMIISQLTGLILTIALWAMIIIIWWAATQ